MSMKYRMMSGMRHSHRPAACNLFSKPGDDGPIAAPRTLPKRTVTTGASFSLKTAQDSLREPFRGAHDIGRIDRLVRRQ